MAVTPELLARGPWRPDAVEASWRDAPWDIPPELEAAADEKIAELRGRGSPTHDGLSGRLASFEERDGRLMLECEPARWAVRLIDGAASDSLTGLCVVRDADGRWLAGRRAAWVATWAEQWALGAGGAVDVGESPVETLSRELMEEWQLTPEALSVEALLRLPTGLAMVAGIATVDPGVEPVPDAEHDEWDWWPADPQRWPEHADWRLRAMAQFLTS
jgi:8-oxo-dGTP pyrophosphatase MutT (NUDIX family)